MMGSLTCWSAGRNARLFGCASNSSSALSPTALARHCATRCVVAAAARCTSATLSPPAVFVNRAVWALPRALKVTDGMPHCEAAECARRQSISGVGAVLAPLVPIAGSCRGCEAAEGPVQGLPASMQRMRTPFSAAADWMPWSSPCVASGGAESMPLRTDTAGMPSSFVSENQPNRCWGACSAGGGATGGAPVPGSGTAATPTGARLGISLMLRNTTVVGADDDLKIRGGAWSRERCRGRSPTGRCTQ